MNPTGPDHPPAIDRPKRHPRIPDADEELPQLPKRRLDLDNPETPCTENTGLLENPLGFIDCLIDILPSAEWIRINAALTTGTCPEAEDIRLLVKACRDGNEVAAAFAETIKALPCRDKKRPASDGGAWYYVSKYRKTDDPVSKFKIDEFDSVDAPRADTDHEAAVAALVNAGYIPEETRSDRMGSCSADACPDERAMASALDTLAERVDKVSHEGLMTLEKADCICRNMTGVLDRLMRTFAGRRDIQLKPGWTTEANKNANRLRLVWILFKSLGLDLVLIRVAKILETMGAAPHKWHQDANEHCKCTHITKKTYCEDCRYNVCGTGCRVCCEHAEEGCGYYCSSYFDE